MILIIKNKLKMLGLLLLLASYVSAQQPAQTVPAFTFFTLDKTEFTNKNLATEKPLFFIFFDASCEHCQRAVKSLNDHYDSFKKSAVYLITSDNYTAINDFINKYGKVLQNKKNVYMLQDTRSEFLSKFKPKKYPAMFLYSSEKKLIRYEDNEDTMFRFYKEINTGTGN